MCCVCGCCGARVDPYGTTGQPAGTGTVGYYLYFEVEVTRKLCVRGADRLLVRVKGEEKTEITEIHTQMIDLGYSNS